MSTEKPTSWTTEREGASCPDCGEVIPNSRLQFCRVLSNGVLDCPKCGTKLRTYQEWLVPESPGGENKGPNNESQ
jgi:predicted RNA-binding Zn-ribbon protein involved in translation (DUF1610 family)